MRPFKYYVSKLGGGKGDPEYLKSMFHLHKKPLFSQKFAYVELPNGNFCTQVRNLFSQVDKNNNFTPKETLIDKPNSH